MTNEKTWQPRSIVHLKEGGKKKGQSGKKLSCSAKKSRALEEKGGGLRGEKKEGKSSLERWGERRSGITAR